ncbi:MAG TPA: ester cyclase [Acidobacteriota bacterium]|nr:ester cyclase [Acidobacteriota bacterium]
MSACDQQRTKARIQCVEEHVRQENLHDLQGVMRTLGDSPHYDVEPLGDHYVGTEAVQGYYADLLRILPDLRIDIKKRHVAADSVVLELVVSGTHSSTWQGIAPTGRRLELPLCAIFTFDAGDKIAGEKIYYDVYSVLIQMGVVRH